MARDTSSGSFDSPSVASSLRVAQEDRGIDFLSNYKPVNIQLPRYQQAIFLDYLGEQMVKFHIDLWWKCVLEGGL